MRAKNNVISKSLLEVWKWKEAVYKDINKKSVKEKLEYYENGLKEATKIINGKLKRKSDGSYIILTLKR